MRKRFLVGAVIPLVVALGIWLGLGAGAAPHHVGKAPASVSKAVVKSALDARTLTVKHARSGGESSASDNDNVQSGDQSTPDTSASETESESESEGDTTSETDNVDCQQQGEFEGVNAAGTGPGCDGSGA
jgi:cytoskeletal protein RodZ